MRVTLLVFPLLVAALASGACSSTKKRQSTTPKQTEATFCTDWAKAACNSKVVTACAAADVDGCVAKQSAYCLSHVPPHYDATNAAACISAVKAAYADAQLTSEELQVVRDLGAPCDELNKGPSEEGETCSTDDDCNTLAKLRCIVKPEQAFGTCQIPVEVGGGFGCTQANETCAVGFYCNGSNCLARLGAGASCSELSPCLEDFQCLGEPGAAVCQEKGNATAACIEDGDCKSTICAKNAAGGGKCVDQVVLAPTELICADLG
jgi:hypothetical protein